MVRAMLDKYLGVEGRKLKILDAGCGTGRTMEDLESYGTVTGIDISWEALSFCRQRGFQNLQQADLSEPVSFKDESFNLIVSLDVLEHVKKDEVAMQEFFRILKKEGLLVLTVPAHPRLWSYWDEMIEHQRRYTQEELEGKVREAGFAIEKMSATNFFIAPLAITIRFLKSFFTIDRQSASSDFVRVPSVVNWVLVQLYRGEAFLLRRVNLPFGLSWLVAARKKAPF